MTPGVVGLDGELVKKSGEEVMNVVGSPYWSELEFWHGIEEKRGVVMLNCG